MVDPSDLLLITAGAKNLPHLEISAVGDDAYATAQ